jgi:hypothetical protein
MFFLSDLETGFVRANEFAQRLDAAARERGRRVLIELEPAQVGAAPFLIGTGWHRQGLVDIPCRKPCLEDPIRFVARLREGDDRLPTEPCQF